VPLLSYKESQYLKYINQQMTNFQAVKQFHNLFGHPNPMGLQRDILTTDPSLINFRLDLINEEFNELKEAVQKNDMTEVIDALGDILYVVYGMGVSLGIDLDKAFKIIHESNLSKLCSTEKEAIASLAHYKTLPDFANTNIAYRQSKYGNFFVIYNVDTGKILKSILFKLPNFSELI